MCRTIRDTMCRMALQNTNDVASEVRGVVAKMQVPRATIASALHVSTMAVSRRMRGETLWTGEELKTLAGLLSLPVGVLYGEVAPISAPVDSPLTRESAGASVV